MARSHSVNLCAFIISDVGAYKHCVADFDDKKSMTTKVFEDCCFAVAVEVVNFFVAADGDCCCLA